MWSVMTLQRYFIIYVIKIAEYYCILLIMAPFNVTEQTDNYWQKGEDVV